jgi:type I restriction enzyme S subunit
MAACEGPGVVTGRYGTIGEVYYVDGPYWPLNTTLYVSDFRGNHPRWVYYLLRSLPLDVDSAKSAVTGINRNVIGQLRVPKPPLSSQVEVARKLDDQRRLIDAVVDPLARQVDLLAEHRQALIIAAVTGEIQVPGMAA